MWRDVKVRYKQTVLEAAWVINQPVVTMMVFAVFFGRLEKVPSDGVPYPLFAYVARTVDVLRQRPDAGLEQLEEAPVALPLRPAGHHDRPGDLLLCLSALNVEYRAVRYVVPFVTQFWLFVRQIGNTSATSACMAAPPPRTVIR